MSKLATSLPIIKMQNDSAKFENEFKKRVYGWVLRDTGKGAGKKLDWLLSELTEISNIIASGILTMKGRK